VLLFIPDFKLFNKKVKKRNLINLHTPFFLIENINKRTHLFDSKDSLNDNDSEKCRIKKIEIQREFILP